MKFNPFAAKKANTNTTQTHFEKNIWEKNTKIFFFPHCKSQFLSRSPTISQQISLTFCLEKLSSGSV